MECIEQCDCEERRLLTVQRLFSAQIARRVGAVRMERNAAASLFSSLPVELQIPILTEALKGSTIGILSTVSARWKTIIEATPQFWSSIDLEKRGNDLERSLKLFPGAPLTITGGDGDRSLKYHDLRRYVALLQRHTDRIRRLTIKTLYLKALHPLLQSSFPRLEFLKIGKNAGRTVHVPPGDMPKLRVLIARAISLSSFSGVVGSLRIVDLALTSFSTSDILDFARRNPGLEDITLNRISSSNPATQPQPPPQSTSARSQITPL